MEDPEDRLDDVILNGVALRPRVNSARNIEFLKKIIFNLSELMSNYPLLLSG